MRIEFNVLNKYILPNRYIILALLVFAAYTYVSYNSSIMVTDFWEHSAVINELQKSITSPKHPIIITDINHHAFFSPYHVFLAVLANIFQTNSISILVAFGIFNLALFLILLPFAIKAIYKSNNYLIITFYALLLIIFLCGASDTWIWSGFFNIKSIKSNLSYPSFFVLNTFLLSIILFTRSFTNIKSTFLFLVIYSFIIVTHPTSFLPVIVLHGFMLIKSVGIKYDSRYLLFVITILSSLFLVQFYPLFPFYKIFTDPDAAVFKDRSFELYDNFISNIWPVLVAMPLLFVKGFKTTLKNPLFHAVFFLLLVYLAGYIFASYGVGRVMGYALLFIQLLYAEKIAALEKSKQSFILVSTLTIILLFSLQMSSLINRFFPKSESETNALKIEAKEGNPDSSIEKRRITISGIEDHYSKFKVLRDLIDPYDIVLSDLRSSWFIPSFSGKVIASYHPIYFQEDSNTRREDIIEFYKKSTTNTFRKKILVKYQVNYILLNHSYFSQNSKSYKDILKLGEITFQNADITLLTHK